MLADWDDRLMPPARALTLAGDWPVYATAELAELSQFQTEGGGGQADRRQINLRCGAASHTGNGTRCDQSAGLLGEDNGPGTPIVLTSIGDLLSGVLRHMVMVHDQPLNGASDDG